MPHPTLAKVLVHEAAFLRNLVQMTSVSQTFLLLMTCKELHAAEEDVFDKHKLPAVCNMRKGDGAKMYRAMVGTPNSRWMSDYSDHPQNQSWLEWLNTSEVKKLTMPYILLDAEMLILFGGNRFSELRTLNLADCRNITDTSLFEVARQCSNLQSLSIGGRDSKITDASSEHSTLKGTTESLMPVCSK